jgi:hypothetical protein
MSNGDAAGCAFLRLLQGLPPTQGQPSHSLIIMNPVPTQAHAPMPAMFLPSLPPSLQHMGQPGMPMMCPPLPRPTEMIHGQVFEPVVRPQPQAANFPVQMPVPLSLFGAGREELVPPPTVIPSEPPNMPLQITAAGKRVKVLCPRFEARCNRISHLPSGDRIVLEGKVRLSFRGNDTGTVSAERVEVDLADGAVEVNPAPPAPAHPVMPVGYYTPVSRQAVPGLLRMAAPCEP